MTGTNPLDSATPLPFLGVLRVAGPDAASFLQGQITHDTRLLADGRTLLAACSTPQGRVVALPRLRQQGDAVYALLPAELVESLAARLKRFVLRARVRVEPALDLIAVAEAGAMATRPSAANDAADGIRFEYSPGRQVLVAPRERYGGSAAPASAGAESAVANAWWSADIAAGLPQVFAASAEAFVPQMLNLDLLDAISFTKGCYTGQEIVARTQHLGRIKRRTFRYRLEGGPAPPPLAGLFRDATKVADVLVSAERDGSTELLAVVNLDARDLPLALEDGRRAEPRPMTYDVPTQASGSPPGA